MLWTNVEKHKFLGTFQISGSAQNGELDTIRCGASQVSRLQAITVHVFVQLVFHLCPSHVPTVSLTHVSDSVVFL